ncbi:phage head-tail joining protein [Thiospirillum jenense]|uniref:GpW protein n=1 Tax=Thiospirillum jenense TaxID=1653858 RepID=A0A839H9P2_9GAMM|nr:hypothetical protein [Thiospirillum jenense]MBB1125564.1 hypothetical protein [Thiospirillum jenense]
MAFTAEQLATLESAAASGTLRVQFGDKVVQYQTLPDLLAAIRLARSDVLDDNTRCITRRRYAIYDRS